VEEAVKLHILGQNLRIKSTEGEETIKRAAACLEKKLDDVRNSSGAVDSLRLLLFAALRITDESLRAKDELARLEEEASSITARMYNMLADSMADSIVDE